MAGCKGWGREGSRASKAGSKGGLCLRYHTQHCRAASGGGRWTPLLGSCTWLPAGPLLLPTRLAAAGAPKPKAAGELPCLTAATENAEGRSRHAGRVAGGSLTTAGMQGRQPTSLHAAQLLQSNSVQGPGLSLRRGPALDGARAPFLLLAAWIWQEALYLHWVREQRLDGRREKRKSGRTRKGMSQGRKARDSCSEYRHSSTRLHYQRVSCQTRQGLTATPACREALPTPDYAAIRQAIEWLPAWLLNGAPKAALRQQKSRGPLGNSPLWEDCTARMLACASAMHLHPVPQLCAHACYYT